MRASLPSLRWLPLAFVVVLSLSGCAAAGNSPAIFAPVPPATAEATAVGPAAGSTPVVVVLATPAESPTSAPVQAVSPTMQPAGSAAGSPSPAATSTSAATEALSPTLEPTPGSGAMPEVTATPAMTGTASAAATEAPGILYRDDFTDPTSGWPNDLEFGSYFIGYHEPEYYHVEVHTAHDRALVAIPKHSFGDATVEVTAFVEPNNTAKTGDFRYGLFFRRTGNEYYAFAISPRTNTWYVLKSSPTGLTELAKGTNDSIQSLTAEDNLRVDAQGSTFYFHINDQAVGQVTDSDYSDGETGFYLETFDSPKVHIHYDDITVRPVQGAPSGSMVLYEDDFTDPTSGWPNDLEFGSYYIGYHEPEYYHVEVHTEHDRALVAIPKHTFGDATMEVTAFVEPNNTAKTGDFRYGLFFRRSGNDYYALAVSPRTSTWYLLKSSPTGLIELAKGTSDSIRGLTAEDTLRVDAKGSTFFVHINDQVVGQVTDSDYTGGEVGFYLETFDSPKVHIHNDKITVRDVEAPKVICSVSTPGLRLRLGPSTDYAIITYLPAGGQLLPLARSAEGLWIQVQVVGSDQKGWVASSPELVDCSIPVEGLPVAQ